MFRISAIVLLSLSASLSAGDSGREDFRKWPARNFNDMKKSGEGFCIYIKDTGARNKAMNAFETKELLDGDTVAKAVKGLMCSKLATNDKAAPSYPPEWIERSKKQAVLVLASNDMARTAVFDDANKNPAAIAAAAEMILKYQKERKAEVAAKAQKEEAVRKAKFAEEVKKANTGKIPGVETNTPKATKPKTPTTKMVEEE